MLLGVVVGEVWTTKKSAALDGMKLLVVAPRCSYGGALGHDHLVAADDLGAGIGEEVVVCFGMPARAAHGGPQVPVEAAIMAIVDRTELVRDPGACPLALGAGGGGR
ncbi:MAG: EutN/CcmL family microcompartment protein [Deltaproteobacteria bacterium]|nr:EutN/CcmL family microcompartment protein [Deltaproteobacteria bacterium]